MRAKIFAMFTARPTIVPGTYLSIQTIFTQYKKRKEKTIALCFKKARNSPKGIFPLLMNPDTKKC